jgi:hypothetical protein
MNDEIHLLWSIFGSSYMWDHAAEEDSEGARKAGHGQRRLWALEAPVFEFFARTAKPLR